MEDGRAQQLQNIKNLSTALVTIEQELLDAFPAQGLPQLNLSEVISTNCVRLQHTYTFPPGVLSTEGCDAKIDLGYRGLCAAPHSRRRWSVELTSTRAQAGRHDLLLSKDDAEARDGSIELDHILLRHADNTSEKEKTYLESKRASIRNTAFIEIDIIKEWFLDEVLDAGFDIISRMLRCEQHHIVILNTAFAYELYLIGRSHPKPLQPTKDLQERLGKTKFVLIPISGGWNGMFEDGESLDTHWTILIIDCHQSTIHTRHYDSNNSGGKTRNLAAAMVVLSTFSSVYAQLRPDYNLDKQTLRANFHLEERTPNQSRDNECIADAEGACGPFIWAFAKEITQYIVECNEDAERLGRHVDVDITLPADFAQRWQWNSGKTRRDLKALLERERRSRIWLIGTHEWFGEKGKYLGWKDWLAIRKEQISSDYFWDPWNDPKN